MCPIKGNILVHSFTWPREQTQVPKRYFGSITQESRPDTVCTEYVRYFSLLTLRRLMSYIYMEHLFLMFLDHTQRRSTVGRTPLDEWSARRRDLYLTKHDTHNRQISMPPVGFEPKISAGERPVAAHLLRSWVRIPPGAWIFVFCVVCCQVEVSATSWWLVQRSPTDCGASSCVI